GDAVEEGRGVAPAPSDLAEGRHVDQPDAGPHGGGFLADRVAGTGGVARRPSPEAGHHHLGAEFLVAALHRRIAPGMKGLPGEMIEALAGEWRPRPGRPEVAGPQPLGTRCDPQDVDSRMATLARAHSGSRPALEKLGM